jgi:GTP-binding protein EngB required for normal cell division
LRVVALVIDARRGLESDDGQMAEFLLAQRPCGPPPRLVLVATKLDKLPLSKQKPLLAKLRSDARRTVIGFSAVNGEGRGELWAAILDAASPATTGAAAGVLASSSAVE